MSDRYDWSNTPPSVAVVETVAGVLDRDSGEIDPLYGSIDPDALNELVGGNVSDHSDCVAVSFPFAGQTVTVHSTGEVTVRPDLV